MGHALSLMRLKKKCKSRLGKKKYFQFTRFSFCLVHKVSFPSKKCTYVCPNTQDQTVIMWPLGLYVFIANTYPHVKLELASLAHELYCLAHWLLCFVLFCFSLFLEASCVTSNSTPPYESNAAVNNMFKGEFCLLSCSVLDKQNLLSLAFVHFLFLVFTLN